MQLSERLAVAVARLHGSSARWLATVAVREEHAGAVVWEGGVEVFALDGHAEATTCYAWEHETDDGQRRVVAVLAVPPINTAADAVRAAIVQEHREKADS